MLIHIKMLSSRNDSRSNFEAQWVVEGELTAGMQSPKEWYYAMFEVIQERFMCTYTLLI